MTADEQSDYDEARQSIIDDRDERDEDEKAAAGFDAMPSEQQALFDISLLAFKEATEAACADDPDDLECTKADVIREAEETQRNLDEYYAKDEAARESDDLLMGLATQMLKLELEEAAGEEEAAEEEVEEPVEEEAEVTEEEEDDADSDLDLDAVPECEDSGTRTAQEDLLPLEEAIADTRAAYDDA